MVLKALRGPNKLNDRTPPDRPSENFGPCQIGKILASVTNTTHSLMTATRCGIPPGVGVTRTRCMAVLGGRGLGAFMQSPSGCSCRNPMWQCGIHKNVAFVS